MLELAAQQRMNTEVRKKIFCTIMGSADYLDAFERLLKLKLKAKQDREIVHVLVDCCLQVLLASERERKGKMKNEKRKTKKKERKR